MREKQGAVQSHVLCRTTTRSVREIYSNGVHGATYKDHLRRHEVEMSDFVLDNALHELDELKLGYNDDRHLQSFSIFGQKQNMRVATAYPAE